MEKWGLGPDELRKDNPGLIYARVSGYGQDGPYSNRLGFASVCEGIGGFRYLNGFADRPPVRPNLSMGDTLAALPVEVDIDPPGKPFHFGRRLAGLVERYNAQRVLYSGGASAPLLSLDRWAEALTRLGEAQRLVITNNIHSCDWLGFTSASEMLPLIAQEASDNALAWILAHEGCLPVESWSA